MSRARNPRFGLTDLSFSKMGPRVHVWRDYGDWMTFFLRAKLYVNDEKLKAALAKAEELGMVSYPHEDDDVTFKKVV